MNDIKYMLFGIGILLFAICMYIFGISIDSSPAMFIGLFSQIIGIIMVIFGFFKKEETGKY